jgi:hypothetical protein
MDITTTTITIIPDTTILATRSTLKTPLSSVFSSEASTTRKTAQTTTTIASCQNNYPKPLYHDKEKTKFNLIISDLGLSTFKMGSYISFECLLGYYVYKSEPRMTTYCQPDGTWTPVDNCIYSLFFLNLNFFE